MPTELSSSSSPVAASVVAFAALRPTDEATRTAVAETLGLAWRQAERRDDPSPETVAASAPEPVPAPARPRAAPAKPDERPPKYEFISPSFNLPISIRAIDEAALSVDPLPRTDPARHVGPPPHEPLLEPRLFRSLITRLVSTKEETRDVDWRRLERSLKNDRVLTSLPWRLRDTVGRSVTVVVDRSGYMQPFLRDQREMLAQLRRLLGKSRLRAIAVEADLDSPEGARLRWRAGAPARESLGEVVLALSSFGLTDPQTAVYAPALCEELADLVRSARVRVAALIPMPAERWPAAFHHLLDAALPWDRSAAGSRMGWLNRMNS